MIINLNNKEISVKNKKYIKYEYDHLTCFFHGFLFCSGKKSGEESINVLIKYYMQNHSSIDFNMLYGAYHVIIFDKKKNKMILFGDNAGFCCFYYNQEAGIISD